VCVREMYWRVIGLDFFHCMVVVSTHCNDTFICKDHIKVNFASDGPFKQENILV